MSEKVDLLSIDRGTVTAPAGCGKTHLILDAVRRHSESKPVLVLTYTNAGVAALRRRFTEYGVPSTSYRLSTLDGFAIRVVGTFPSRSGLNPKILMLENPRRDYAAIKHAVCRLLLNGHINDVLAASYSRLIVDEYQDCCVRQHEFVSLMASVLPTCVLGDPLQAVFSWIGLPAWKEDVCSAFPIAGELTTPWRWRNAGTEDLGQWLLHIRKKLIAGEPIDFSDAPREVSWIDLATSDNCYQCQLSVASTRHAGKSCSTLIIGNGKYPEAQRKFASRIPGAVTVENVNLDDLIDFAKRFDFSSPNALTLVLEFSKKVMRNINIQHFLGRINSLENGRARIQASDAEKAALSFKANQNPAAAVNLLVELNKGSDVSSHRPTVLRACIKALNTCSYTDDDSFLDAAIRAREQNRMLGRSLPQKAVGSTLLLKGLEADVAVILDAADHDINSLYVAMTRGSKKLVICSHSSMWTPR